MEKEWERLEQEKQEQMKMQQQQGFGQPQEEAEEGKSFVVTELNTNRRSRSNS
jgi:hypothetical protein